MGATYRPFISTSLPADSTKNEKLKVVSDFARLGVCFPSFNELLDDNTMIVVREGSAAPKEEQLYEFQPPTEAVLKAAKTGGSAPYSLLDLLEGFHVLVEDKGLDRCDTDLTVPNNGKPYQWNISVKSYDRCLSYLKYKMKELADDKASYWKYCDYDKPFFRDFYKELIEDLEVCQAANVVFIFSW